MIRPLTTKRCRCGGQVYRPPRFMGRRMAARCVRCDYIIGRCRCAAITGEEAAP